MVKGTVVRGEILRKASGDGKANFSPRTSWGGGMGVAVEKAVSPETARQPNLRAREIQVGGGLGMTLIERIAELSVKAIQDLGAPLKVFVIGADGWISGTIHDGAFKNG